MKINFKNILIALIEKEFKSYLRSINNLINMIVFMIAIIILFPLTMGPSEEKLTLVSNAIVWISLIISIIPTLDKIYIGDFKNGWLEQYYFSPLLLEIIILIKCFVFWFFLISLSVQVRDTFDSEPQLQKSLNPLWIFFLLNHGHRRLLLKHSVLQILLQ